MENIKNISKTRIVPAGHLERWTSNFWILRIYAFTLRLRTVELTDTTESPSQTNHLYAMVFRTTSLLVIALNAWLVTDAIRYASANETSIGTANLMSQLAVLAVTTAVQLMFPVRPRLLRSTITQADRLFSDVIEGESIRKIRRQTSVLIGAACLGSAFFLYKSVQIQSEGQETDGQHSGNQTRLICNDLLRFCYDLDRAYSFICLTSTCLLMITFYDIVNGLNGLLILKQCFTDLGVKAIRSMTDAADDGLSQSKAVDETMTQFLIDHRKCTAVVNNVNSLFGQQTSLLVASLIACTVIEIRELDLMSDDFLHKMTHGEIPVEVHVIASSVILTVVIIKLMADVNTEVMSSLTSLADAPHVCFFSKNIQKSSKSMDQQLTWYMEETSAELPGLQVSALGLVTNEHIIYAVLTILSFGCIVYGL